MAEYLRILRCDNCRTLEELPDYEGDPQNDQVLEALILRRHTEPSGTTHVGQLMRVEKKHWDSPTTRKEILRELGKQTTGLDPEAYAAADAFKEDAMACWKRHNRNPECPDYKSPEKRLLPNTAEERKEAGLPKYETAPKNYVYLCDWCPAKSVVQEKVFGKAGLYK